jgi:hypothetical protein
MKYLNARLLRLMFAYMVIVCVALSACGCESFTRKFTRKQKKQDKPQESMVLAPEVYPDSQANKEDAYRQYFTYWSSWHDELLDSLADSSWSMRKLLDSIQEAYNNLAEMAKMLSEDKKIAAEGFLASMNVLKADIERDLYGNNVWSIRKQAESLKRQINRDLQYRQVKDFLR